MATAGYRGVVYNESTQKFRCLKNNGSALSDFSVQGKEAAFDCNQVGLELVASDFGRNNYVHILMKDASGHHYLLVADFCGIFTQNAIGKAKYDLGGCEGLDKKVVSVTAGYKGEIFYYANLINIELDVYSKLSDVEKERFLGMEITDGNQHSINYRDVVKLKNDILTKYGSEWLKTEI